MKREGEEGDGELKLPGKERNRVGLNLLDCFQLHASTRHLPLSTFIFSFFIRWNLSYSLANTLFTSSFNLYSSLNPPLR